MCLHTYRHVETTTQHGKGAKGHRSQLCRYFPSPPGKNSRGGAKKLEKTLYFKLPWRVDRGFRFVKRDDTPSKIKNGSWPCLHK